MICKKKKYHHLSVRELDKDFVSSNIEYEQYALVYSKNLEVIANGNKEQELEEDLNLDRFVKICANGNTVRRKCRGYNGCQAGEIMLGSRTRKELGIGKDTQVCVKSSSMICYYWNNSEGYVKWGFRIAIFGFCLTILSSIVTLTPYLCKFVQWLRGLIF